MKLLDSVIARIDSAEIDPRPFFKQRLAEMIEEKARDIPAEIAENLFRPLLWDVAGAAVDILEGRNQSMALRDLLIPLDYALNDAVRTAQTSGPLKPITVANEILRLKIELRDCLYKGMECDSLAALLVDGEQLVKVELRTITTDRRQVLRSDLFNVLKPAAGWTNAESWESQFVSERHLAEKEEADHRAAEAAKYPPWVDNFDRGGFPGGVRPKP